MTTAIGLISVVFGIVCILWGDKDIKVKEGMILRIFSWRGSAKWIKWPMGLVLIYAGIRIIFHA
jgi:threonine/homoserine/homoserine lactone efflux protein